MIQIYFLGVNICGCGNEAVLEDCYTTTTTTTDEKLQILESKMEKLQRSTNLKMEVSSRMSSA
eukprot:CAMPEP_0172514614 /NCGR_PEP_ID=MMETSP1066-20121228/261326_1 /TAXON_ID=671091 /ORGANISM="Coscinodiscus wailesii, Strain CCMP2513" /LENGTH=62 /DNA_ID=CAMNT_0013295341 /DNA_START=52 /DNA_END=236 /DNA_ORIENTATION=+